MIKEEYVQHDTAKLLKDAGYPQDTRYVRDSVKHLVSPVRPTQAQAMRWLREEKNLAILFKIISPSEAQDYDLIVGAYRMDLYETNTGYHLGVDESDGIGADMVGHHTYEEAAEAGIQAACKYIVQNSRCKS